MGLAGFASMLSMRMCDPMLVVLGQEFQVSTGEASRVVSAFAVAYGVLQLFYGPLGDRFGKLRVISLAALACAVFSAITSLSADLMLLVVMRAFMGAAAAGIVQGPDFAIRHHRNGDGGADVAPMPGVTGKAIDKDWTSFHPDSGTKNLPRASMPPLGVRRTSRPLALRPPRPVATCHESS